MARGHSTCARTDYLPLLPNWYSSDYWIYRQVLSICRSDSWPVLSTGYCRNTQFGSVAVLLSETDPDDVLRAASGRLRHRPLRGMELRRDGLTCTTGDVVAVLPH